MAFHWRIIFLMWEYICSQRSWAQSGLPTQAPRTRSGRPGGIINAENGRRCRLF